MAFTNLVSLFDQATPDTSGYFIAGYVVIFTVMLLYLASLIIRERNLEKDYETLQELEKIDAQKAQASAPEPVKSPGK